MNCRLCQSTERQRRASTTPDTLPVQGQARALSLVETLFCIVIVGGLLVASLSTVSAVTLSRKKTGDFGRGALLAQSLISEILQQAYQEPVDTVQFGREGSETNSSRALYDDVDDYNGWTASPPQEKDGTVIPNLVGWTQSVVVNLVDSNDFSTVRTTDEGVKRITVTIKRNGLVAGAITALRTGESVTGVDNPIPDPGPGPEVN